MERLPEADAEFAERMNSVGRTTCSGTWPASRKTDP
jgi:hypothetical protein